MARLRAAGCVLAETEAELLRRAAGADAAALDALVVRRVGGEPLEHVLGWAELAGRRWSVGPGVFVPRRRSELLIDVAARLVLGAPTDAATEAGTRGTRRPLLLDLCCGCGAVGGAVLLAARADGVEATLHASDVDPVATAHAQVNVGPLGGSVHTGDLFAPLPRHLRGAVDVLTCHAPYVPTGAIRTLPPEAREHEPVVALDGGGDGLDVVRRVAAEAPDWLAPGGSLLVEAGEGQVEVATALLADAGFRVEVVRGDDEPWDDEPWDDEPWDDEPWDDGPGDSPDADPDGGVGSELGSGVGSVVGGLVVVATLRA